MWWRGLLFSLPYHRQEVFRPSARNFSAFSKEPSCFPQETAPKKYPTILCNVPKDKLPSIQYYFAKYPCFGEHLLTDKTTTKTIATVVSEKTAIIATHFISDFVWLATGGMNGCFNKDAVEVLSGREVVLVPDLGATDKWKSKLPLLQSICKQVLVSNILEDNATDEQKTNGLDIADFLLMTETPQMALQRLIRQHPPLQHLIDSLGLVLVEEP